MKKASKKKRRKKTPQRPTSNRKLPHVQAALLCENILQENGVPTLVRVIDTITVSSSEDSLPAGIISYHIYIAFKSGEALGRRTLRLVGNSPSGKRTSFGEAEIEFKGEETGAAINVVPKIVITEEGVHWIDVFINRTLMTRIPFRIRYQKAQAAQSSPSRKKKK